MAEYLTTRQIAEASGRSTDTVVRAIKRLFPGRLRERSATFLTRDQAQIVMLAIRVKPERLMGAAVQTAAPMRQSAQYGELCREVARA